MLDDSVPILIHGRYRYLAELGRGGMGRVVLVEDLKEGVQRALKWVPAAGDDVSPEAVRQLREFQILSRFQHPNLLRVFEYGRVHPGGGYFFTSECLTGPTVRDLIGAVSEEQSRRTLVELFRSLSFLHRQGWVHGDIKPDNLRLRAPVGERHADLCLLDFGLAHPEGRPPEEKILGTVHYMPPERLLGGRIDRRGDLYSAGVLAFQMLTGRLPFRGSRKTEIFEGHLRKPPPDPREFVPDISSELAELLFSLLEKRPEDRPADAEQVIQVFERHWGSYGGPESTETLLAHVRLGEEGGWDGPIAQVQRRVRERCGDGGPVYRRWLKTATPETSSSRPMRAASLSSSAGCPGMVIARARERGDNRAFRERILRRLQVQGHAILSWDAAGAGALARLDLEVRRMSGGRERPEGTVATSRDVLSDLARLSRDAPVTVFVDGANEGRSETFALLSEAVALDRRLEGLSSTAWVALVDRFPGAWFAEWLARPDVRLWSRTVDLPRLDAEGVEAALRQRFPGWSPAPQMVDRLLEDSLGSPSQLERRLCEFVRRKGITRSWSGWEARDLPPPESSPIVARASRSFARLPELERKVLEALAVLDHDADPADLQRIAGIPAGQTPEVLITLARRGWIDREPEAGRYRFRRRFQGIGVAATLDPRRRRELHRICGDLLEAQSQGRGDVETWSRLSRHRIVGDQLPAAWVPLLQFVEHGAKEGDPSSRIRRAEDFLAKDASSSVPGLTAEHRAVLHDGLGALRLRQGDVAGAEREWRLAERYFSSAETAPRRRGRLQTRLGALLLRKGAPAEALPRLRDSLRALAGNDRGDLMRKHFLLLAEANLIRGEPAASKELWDAIDKIDPTQDPSLDAEGVLLRADHSIALGHVLLARRQLLAGLVRIESAGDRLAGWCAWLLGRAYSVQRNAALAREQYRLAAEIFQRQQQPLWEGRALLDLAEGELGARRVGDAERTLLRAERQLARSGAGSDRPRLLWLRAALLGDGGWVKEARATLIELAEWGESLPHAPWRWEGSLLEAVLTLRAGHLVRAAELLGGAAHPRTAPHAHLGDTWCRWAVLAMRLELRKGRPAAALRLGDEAIAEARERTDPEGLGRIWRERIRILNALGCVQDAERLSAMLGDEEETPAPDAEAGGEELAEHYSALAKAAAAAGDLSQASIHLEEALFHALRVRALPSSAILPLSLALVRARDDQATEFTARQAWRRLVRTGVRYGRIEVLCLWAQARARAESPDTAARLRRAAVREIARWSADIPLAHDLFTLARGLDADAAVLDAISEAIRTD